MPAFRPQQNLFEPGPALSTRELPVTFTISGDTPSKKNSKQIVVVKGRTLIIPSQYFKRWHKAAMKELEWNDGPLPEGLLIHVTIYPGSRRAGDLTNKAESCLDLLVEKGVLVNDNWFIVSSVTLQFGGVDKFRPRAEVVIERSREWTNT